MRITTQQFVFWLFLCPFLVYAQKCICSIEDIVCNGRVEDGYVISIPKCPEARSFRSVGVGFVTNIQGSIPEKIESVVIHRSNLHCDEVTKLFHTAEVTINEQKCPGTTTVNITLPSPAPRHRPPIRPMDDNDDNNDNGDDDDNDDDDPGNDDNDDGSNDDSDRDDGSDRDDDSDSYGDSDSDDNDTTSRSNTTAMITTSTEDSRPVIVIRGSVAGLVVTFVVAVSAGGMLFIIIIRYRRRRRQEDNNNNYDNPIQLNEVSTTTDVPVCLTSRSPRRRRSTSVESVTLYAVNEHKD